MPQASVAITARTSTAAATDLILTTRLFLLFLVERSEKMP